jgi:hypothetical protein
LEDLSDTSIKRLVLLTKELARRSGHAGKLGIVAGLFVAFYEWFSEPEDYLDYDPRVLGPVEPKNPSSGAQRDIDVTVEAEPALK